MAERKSIHTCPGTCAAHVPAVQTRACGPAIKGNHAIRSGSKSAWSDQFDTGLATQSEAQL